MSRRAAWRLERLGFREVYDFAPGKMTWLAMGWPREGTAAEVPNAGEVARRGIPTCALENRVGSVREKVRAVGRHVCIVVNEAGSWTVGSEEGPSRNLPVSDLDRATTFHEYVLGFTPDIEDPGGISYRSGNGRFNIYPTQFAGTAQHTLIGWHTDDLETAIDDLVSLIRAFRSALG
jgi:hypothetical protein